MLLLGTPQADAVSSFLRCEVARENAMEARVGRVHERARESALTRIGKQQATTRKH